MTADPLRLLNLLRQSWRRGESELCAFLDEVGASAVAHTVTIRLIPIPITSPEEFINALAAKVKDDGAWSFATTSPDGSGQQRAYAMPVATVEQDGAFAFPFVEIHTLLVAWWLTAAWRARQLSNVASALAASSEVIAAAACVRSLVETAAASWVDGRKIVAAWGDIKRAGEPSSDPEALHRRLVMMKVLNELMWGAKFDDRAPELKRLWGRVERSNVLGQVEKLAKAVSGDLESDYQWLCNTVHPSIGNTFAFSAPPFMHETGTHMITWFAGHPIHIERGGEVIAETTVETATARAADVATRTLRLTLDSALRTIDDLGLTTGAPAIAREPYWRNLTARRKDEPCPCRSGRNARDCRHKWGDPAPPYPSRFDWDPALA